mmetsp:Transcript_9549/g.9585  ORF Transcript_9549/g.9585 Transcript_9549/m.9585 type:complete len:703 (-) Transcript_9549:138-2246(-)
MHSSHQPTVSSGYNSMVEYCIHPEEAYYGMTVTAGVMGISAQQPWENFWTASASGGMPTVGTTNTFMTFKLVGTPGNFNFILESYHDILPHEKFCVECNDLRPDDYKEDDKSSGGAHISTPDISVSAPSQVVSVPEVDTRSEYFTPVATSPIITGGSSSEGTSASDKSVIMDKLAESAHKSYGGLPTHSPTQNHKPGRHSHKEMDKRAAAYVKTPMGPGRKGRDNTVLTSSASSSVSTSTSVSVDPTYLLYGMDNTWSSWMGYGTTFDVSSLDGCTIYYQGQLCGSRTKYNACDLGDLKEGTYVWRVTGSADTAKEAIAWEFCGVHGSVQTQVVFEIDEDGYCIPLSSTIVDVSEYSNKMSGFWKSAGGSVSESDVSSGYAYGSGGSSSKSSGWSSSGGSSAGSSTREFEGDSQYGYAYGGSSKGWPSDDKQSGYTFTSSDAGSAESDTFELTRKKWTIGGSVELKTKKNHKLSKREKVIVTKAIADVLNSASLKRDVSTKDIFLLSSSELDLAEAESQTDYQTVNFEVSVTPESYGYDSKYDEAAGSYYLKEGIQEYMEKVVDSGIFYTELQTIGNSQGLGEIFEELEDVQIGMDFTKTKSESHSGDVHSDTITIALGYIGIAVVVTLLVVVAARGIVSRGESPAADNDLEHSSSSTVSSNTKNSARVFTRPALPYDSFSSSSRIGHNNLTSSNELESLQI